jgi:hypothetical protein
MKCTVRFGSISAVQFPAVISSQAWLCEHSGARFRMSTSATWGSDLRNALGKSSAIKIASINRM